MSIEALMPPQARIAAWVAKNAMVVLLGLLLSGLGGYMVWKSFFAGREAQAVHDVVQANGQAAIAGAGAQSGKDAVGAVTNNYNYSTKVDRQTQENQRAILQAPGAGQQVDPDLDALVRRDICLRDSAGRLPECVALLGPHP